MAQTSARLQSWNAVFELDGRDMNWLVAASAGVSHSSSRDAADVSGLLQSSDAAMYEAKRQREKQSPVLYAGDAGERQPSGLELETQLRRALDRKRARRCIFSRRSRS